MTLTGDGSLKGSITVKYTGADALEHRLDALNTDEAGRKKALEDELKGWIPSGAIVKIADVEGMQAVNDPVIARFDVELPGYASAAGKRLLLAGYLFQARKKDAFKHPERKYPVYFPYAFAEVDKIGIRLPAGYSVEGTPQPQQAGVPYARYTNTIQFQNSRLTTDRSLIFNGMFIDTAKYAEVKDFFSKVQVGDEQQAVVRIGEGGNAKQGN